MPKTSTYQGEMLENSWETSILEAITLLSRPRELHHLASTPTSLINTSLTELNPFSKEQMEVLQKMLQQSLQSSTSTVGSGSLAQKGNFLISLNVKREKSYLRIVDLGASDHMTKDITMFHMYKPCFENLTVWIIDGLISKVASIGLVFISKDLTLKLVLYEPKS